MICYPPFSHYIPPSTFYRTCNILLIGGVFKKRRKKDEQFEYKIFYFAFFITHPLPPAVFLEMRTEVSGHGEKGLPTPGLPCQ